MRFTHLEENVLAAICAVEPADAPILYKLLSTAVVVSRENTGHGFYTEFTTTASESGPWQRMIKGPCARMLDMGEDAVMSFILWCSEQGPTTLEGFQLGDAAGDTIDPRKRDLESLRFSEIGY